MVIVVFILLNIWSLHIKMITNLFLKLNSNNTNGTWEMKTNSCRIGFNDIINVFTYNLINFWIVCVNLKKMFSWSTLCILSVYDVFLQGDATFTRVNKKIIQINVLFLKETLTFRFSNATFHWTKLNFRDILAEWLYGQNSPDTFDFKLFVEYLK